MSDLEALGYDRIAFKASHNSIDRLAGLPVARLHRSSALWHRGPLGLSSPSISTSRTTRSRGYNLVHRRTWDTSVEGGANILSGDLDSDDLSLGGDGMAPVGGDED